MSLFFGSNTRNQRVFFYTLDPDRVQSTMCVQYLYSSLLRARLERGSREGARKKERSECSKRNERECVGPGGQRLLNSGNLQSSVKKGGRKRKNCAIQLVCMFGCCEKRRVEEWVHPTLMRPSERAATNKHNKHTLITRTSELNTLSSHQQIGNPYKMSLIYSLSRLLLLLPYSLLVFIHPPLTSKVARRKEGRTQRPTAPAAAIGETMSLFHLPLRFIRPFCLNSCIHPRPFWCPCLPFVLEQRPLLPLLPSHHPLPLLFLLSFPWSARHHWQYTHPSFRHSFLSNMNEKQELEYDKDVYAQEKTYIGDTLELNEEDEVKNSKIEAVRLGKSLSLVTVCLYHYATSSSF